jgi:PIN domain nuclease of toxin-antitoxin system
MKLLLDSHILLWWLMKDSRLPVQAWPLIEEPENIILVSAASIWELALKSALGKLELDFPAFQVSIIESRLEPLPVTFEHAGAVAALPRHHADPFDRMLVAQSLAEKARLLTHDTRLSRYGNVVLVV